MSSITDEIQLISENAEKCINYPIGDKLAAFIKQQDESNKTNFVLSGVVIYCSAKIFGRKVDYLEQEIHGIAKNFAAVETSTEPKQNEKEIKKTRTKKFKIQDGVNLAKVSFEETPIQVSDKVDINKTLAMPSRINRLQKMKDFFSKNKSRTGKLVIPKNLLFTNDYLKSNFGSSQIYEYDDNKDIVGSRTDFASYSYFLNSATGELQSDICLTDRVDRSTFESEDYNDINTYERLNEQNLPPTPPPEIHESPTDWDSIRNSTVDVTLKKSFSLTNINIDEGIELDEAKFNLLKPSQLTIKLIDMRVTSPNFFPRDSIDIKEFTTSMEAKQDVVTPIVKTKAELDLQMKNIFMIPLKRLNHRCIFDLPNDEYGELKKRKRNHHKPFGVDLESRATRVFNSFKLSGGFDDFEDHPFKGFTKAQQKETMTFINYPTMKNLSVMEMLKNRLTSLLSSNDRKYSNDSGVETDFSDRTRDITDSDDQGHADDCLNSKRNNESHNIYMSKIDSCYQSLASGGSGKAELSSFFKNIESRNLTFDESEITFYEQPAEESEERVSQMQQSAIKIAKWKEYLKPILADSEARSKIDMHEFGKGMINKIGNVNESKTLADITQPGKTPAYFLTMLQLINNRNVEINFGERSMRKPVDIKNIQITLKSKLLSHPAFQFEQQEEKITCLKRKAVLTSTPAKRSCIAPGYASISFNSLNMSQSMIERQNSITSSQASSGYFSQSSIFSGC